jgi:hypothetical protein
MISAVSPRGTLYFRFLPGPGNSVYFIGFLQDLMDDIEGRIFLIVDGHSSHTSKAMREFVAQQDGRITIFTLALYSPEPWSPVVASTSLDPGRASTPS